MNDFKNFFLFDGLSEEEISLIVDKFPPVCSFSKGEVIYSEKTFFSAIGYIISGSVSAVANNKNGVVMKKFTGGMSFGAAAVFGERGPYVSTVKAESKCEIQFIDEEILREIFARFPKTAINYITFLSDKIRFLNKKIGIISCSNAEDRVLKYLIDSADSEGVVLLPDNISLLAKSLSLGRTSFYRSLEALHQNGNIIREKNIIRVKKL